MIQGERAERFHRKRTLRRFLLALLDHVTKERLVEWDRRKLAQEHRERSAAPDSCISCSPDKTNSARFLWRRWDKMYQPLFTNASTFKQQYIHYFLDLKQTIKIWRLKKYPMKYLILFGFQVTMEIISWRLETVSLSWRPPVFNCRLVNSTR